MLVWWVLYELVMIWWMCYKLTVVCWWVRDNVNWNIIAKNHLQQWCMVVDSENDWNGLNPM